ncbi:MAG: formate/nitrite transporter family protein [Clostridiales bacterium]|nr:formate/nitrite transporter family protein [Clostridiales bacterium]
MYYDDFLSSANAAKAKTQFLNTNPLGYFISSIMAGIFIGLGVILIFTIGGFLTGTAYAKIIMGASFGIALSLVIMAGAELFTGNNFIMVSGLVSKKVTFLDCLKVWLVSFVGNWLGSVLVAFVFYKADLSVDKVGEFIALSASVKMNLPIASLFFRGILCNMLVCLAIWCSFRCKSESGKLIMIFWCLFAFITSGFEHSIANMTLLSIGLMAPFSASIGFVGYFYNILIVSLGNMVGGILFIALPYFLISKKENI